MKILKMISIISSFLIFIGCSPKEVPTPVIPAKTIETSEKASWEGKWENWLAEAKKEGKVVVVRTPGGATVRKALQDGFKNRHGLIAEIIEAGVGLIQQKVLAEHRAGIYTSDIYMGGSTTLLGDLKPVISFHPLNPVLILPEVINPKVWLLEKLDYLNKEHLVLAFQASVTIPWGINTELVKLKDEPKYWQDLLETKWKGKILMGDPRITGVPNSNFMVMSYYGLGCDYWRELRKQEPTIIRDQRQQVEWLAQSKFSILISPMATIMMEFSELGAPIKLVLPSSEFTALSSASGNLALMNLAPHPNAAKIFINWLLTKEGLTIQSVATGYQSGRVDVPTDHLNPLNMRQPGVKYIASYTEEFLAKREQAMKDAAEIFGR